jgi:hypothetical protein
MRPFSAEHDDVSPSTVSQVGQGSKPCNNGPLLHYAEFDDATCASPARRVVRRFPILQDVPTVIVTLVAPNKEPS